MFDNYSINEHTYTRLCIYLTDSAFFRARRCNGRVHKTAGVLVAMGGRASVL